MSKQTFTHTIKNAVSLKNIPEEFRGWKIDCCKCGCKRQVISSQTVNRRYDATEVYTLECGHTVI